MARSIDIIYKALERTYVNFSNAVGVIANPSNWSKTDYKRLALSTIATSQGVLEQTQDSYIEDAEGLIKTMPFQTPAWIQNMMINVFQYDATTPQIIQLNITDKQFTFYYPIENNNFKIIKYCSVVPGILGTTLIKIAADSGGAPSQIIAPSLDAAQTFANTITFDGLFYNVVSLDADRLFLQLDVYYDGLYSAVIETNVTNAIKAYLLEKNTKDFNGTLLLSDLEVRIRAVTGVKDVVFVNVQARANTTSVGTGTNLVLNYTTTQRNYPTISGWCIPEDTIGANWRLTDYRVGSSGLKNLNLISQ